MRARILPCDWLIALAQICGTFRSTRFAVISTLDSIDEPVATTAMEKSWAPIWRRASMLRASAWTAWVTRSDHFCTSAAFSSTTSTSRSSRSSWPAVAAPKRPSPMMSTGASWGILSTNDGPLFWSSEKLAALGCRQCCGQGHCTNAPRPHGCGQHVFTGIRKLRRQAGGEAGCSEGRDDVEQYEIERCLGELQEENGCCRDDGGAPQRDAHRESQDVGWQSALEHLHVAVAAGLGESREEEHGKSGHFDAAGRGSRTATDEHEHVEHEEARPVHLGDVDGREPARARHHRHERSEEHTSELQS